MVKAWAKRTVKTPKAVKNLIQKRPKAVKVKVVRGFKRRSK
jgi:phage-related protein